MAKSIEFCPGVGLTVPQVFGLKLLEVLGLNAMVPVGGLNVAGSNAMVPVVGL